MKTVAIIFAAFAAILLTFASLGFLRFKAKAKQEYAHATEAFFKAANTLVGVQGAPLELLEIVDHLNNKIDDASEAWKLFRHTSEYRWWKERGARASRHSKVVKEYLATREELQDTYNNMVVSWFLAVTSLAPFAGTLARIAMTDTGVKQAASQIETRDHSNGALPRSGERTAVA